jgi:hypothetical protein
MQSKMFVFGWLWLASASAGCVVAADLEADQANPEGADDGEPDESDESDVAPQAVTGFQMVGLGSSVFGAADHNRCVVDVQSAFQALPGSPSGYIRYRSQGGNRLPPFNARLATFGSWDSHIQSFGRLAGVGDNRWAVVTRSNSGNIGGAGVFMVHLGDVNGVDGSRWVPPGGGFTGDPPSLRGTQFYYPIPGTEHPGGLQTIGHKAVVVSEAPVGQPSFVELYDFSSPGVANALVQRFTLNGGLGEPVAPARALSGAALAKLEDGRYLLFVLGKDTDRNGWFYVSDRNSIEPATGWQFLDYVSQADGSFVGEFRAYQNVGLFTECGTRHVYLVATNNADFSGPLDSGQDYADLFRLTASGSTVTLTRVAARNFHEGSGGYCTFRAAANVHVDAQGDLILYCHTHHSNTNIFGTPDSKLKLAEYAP